MSKDTELEAAIRRIVREELKSLMKSLAKVTEDPYETGNIEQTAYKVIRTVAKTEFEMLPCAWDCDTRSMNAWDTTCTCGVAKGPLG